MSEFDWMSPVAYDRAQGAELTGLAWECLRRNDDFQLRPERHVDQG